MNWQAEIVSTDKCDVLEIAVASAEGRLYVDPETSQGFILRENKLES